VFNAIANFCMVTVPNAIDKMVTGFQEMPNKLKQIGSDLVKGLWNGINEMGNWLKDQITSFANNIVDGFKGAFGISTPPP